MQKETVQAHLDDIKVSQVELGDGLGPHADADPLRRRRIRLNQHLPQILVHLQHTKVPEQN